VTIEDEEAIEHARLLSRSEGILAGDFIGANLAAAIKVASRE